MNQSRMLNTTGSASAVDAGRVAMKIFDVVTQASMTATMQAKDLVQAIVIASHSAVAGIHTLAKVVGRDADSALTSTQVLFAALLAYHASPYETEKGRAISEFSPIILVDALRDFEKLTGRQPDEGLVQSMCEACREFVADPANVSKMMKERDLAIGQARTVN